MKRNYLNFYGNLMKASDDYLVERPRRARVGDHVVRLDALRRHPGHPHRRPRRDGPGARRPAPEELQLLRGVHPRARSSTPTRGCSRSRGARARWSRTWTSCRPWPASSPRRQSARSAWQGVTTRGSSCGADAAPRAGLHRLHLRRLPVRPVERALVPPPQHIVSMRETRWKIARYYDPAGTVRPEWEMYDLQTDPARDHQPRPAAATGARRPRTRSTCGCAGSSRGAGDPPAAALGGLVPPTPPPRPRARRALASRPCGAGRLGRGAHRAPSPPPRSGST